MNLPQLQFPGHRLNVGRSHIKYFEYHIFAPPCKPPSFWVNKAGYTAFCKDQNTSELSRERLLNRHKALVFIIPIRNMNCCRSIPSHWQLNCKEWSFPCSQWQQSTARPFAHAQQLYRSILLMLFHEKPSWCGKHLSQEVNLSSDLYPQASNNAFFTGSTREAS